VIKSIIRFLLKISKNFYKANSIRIIFLKQVVIIIAIKTSINSHKWASYRLLSFIDRELIRHFVFSDLSNNQSDVGIIYELLLAKSGLHVISSLCVADIDCIIHHLCVS